MEGEKKKKKEGNRRESRCARTRLNVTVTGASRHTIFNDRDCQVLKSFQSRSDIFFS